LLVVRPKTALAAEMGKPSRVSWGLKLLLGWRIVQLLRGKVSLPPGGHEMVDGFRLSHGKDLGEMLSSFSKLLGCVVRWVHI
jgi:hypothetical protein